MSLQEDRTWFNTQTAPVLAERVGVHRPWHGHGSERFAYFCDDQRLVIVAGPQEGSHVDLAFAHGLEHRGSRRLVLFLPEGGAAAAGDPEAGRHALRIPELPSAAMAMTGISRLPVWRILRSPRPLASSFRLDCLPMTWTPRAGRVVGMHRAVAAGAAVS